MKKLFFTLALALCMVLTASAQNRGLFGYGQAKGETEESYWGFENRGLTGGLSLPNAHGESGDTPAPLGMGTALLIGMGAAYMITKKRKK